MLVVWRLGKCTAGEILANIGSNRWLYTTLTTFLNRIVKKGYLKSTTAPGLRYNQNLYSPAVAFDDAMRVEIALFIDTTMGREPRAVELLLDQLKKLRLLPPK